MHTLIDEVNTWIHTVVSDTPALSTACQSLAAHQLQCRAVGKQKHCWAFDSPLPLVAAAASRGAQAISVESVCDTFVAAAGTLPPGVCLGDPAQNAWHLRIATLLPVAEQPQEAPAVSQAPEAPAQISRQPLLSELTMRMVPARFDADAFQLYKKYQHAVHGDALEDITRANYERFLVQSPLKAQSSYGPSSTASATHEALTASGEKRDAAASRALEAAAAAAPSLQQLLPTLASKLGISQPLVEQLLVAYGCSVRRLLQAVTPLAPLLAALPGEAHAELLSSQLRIELDNLTCLHDALAATLVEPVGAGEHLKAARRALAGAWREGMGSGAGIPLQGAASGTGAVAPTPGVIEARGADPCAAAAYAPSGSDMRLGYGSFHQKYYWGEQLVAVGVVDILPLCLSSVYLFYDPSLPQLCLGKLTALCEMQWVRAAQASAPRLRFYYMGFYVASCSKMRYKGDYVPSELLCPVSLRWVPLAPLATRLRSQQCFHFAQHAAAAAAGAVHPAHYPCADAWLQGATGCDCMLVAAMCYFLLVPRGKSPGDVMAGLGEAAWADSALHAAQLQAPGSSVVLRMLARLVRGMGRGVALRVGWAL